MAIKLRTFHKLCICSRCNIFSFVKYYDLICLFYRRHLMCYHNNGLALTELCQRFVDKLFILCIRIRSCLIKNKYRSIFKEQSTDCNSLLFSSRKVVPTITNHCLILIRKRHNKVMYLCFLRSSYNIIHCSCCIVHSNVSFNSIR